MRRSAIHNTFGCALIGAAMCVALPASAQDEKPNVVFILVDNVGYGDWSVYGGTTATPRIDELAAEGLRFTNYNVEVQCTPSRSAIMTGRHPVRSGTYSVLPPPGGQDGLTPWEYTIGELLSDSGYATALYGKWHLGNVQGRLPNDQGFDEWWGIPNSWDQSGFTSYPMYNLLAKEILAEEKKTELLNVPPHVLEGKKGEPSKPAMDLDMNVRPVIDADYLIPKTVNFIKEQAAAKKPFFVYLGYSEMHPPIQCNPAFVGTSPERGGMYSDCIAEMDYRVGQVLDGIKEAGVEDNTIVVLSSDNATGGLSGGAGANGGSNGPFRGDFFYTPFEGSMRVPAIVRWPGKFAKGQVTDEMLAAVDWMPTLASLVSASSLVPTDRPIDGKDASDFMLGKSKTTGREDYMFFGTDGELMSVKWRNYKMIKRMTAGPAFEAIDQAYIEPQLPLFFDLSSDPHEDFNLWTTTLTMAWLFDPMLHAIGAYEKSVKKYPNIPAGAKEFKGYSQ
ncbi:arylsulfatase [Roseovarius sp. M141]|uniref:arylsulfatase n=1 Tax=Roseovarius sp. M141 TaxID=2583806 RepID=UPI0020CC46A8|nr:arylsulfatase [Roseovarius sp. M141]MCQ0091859.1 arylsulfatase [Roseovarius sp. M141]